MAPILIGIDGDVIAYRCGFAAEKTRYDIYHAADVQRQELIPGEDAVYRMVDDAAVVETFDNAKLCKEWLQMQGAAGEHYIRVPRKEIDDVSHALHTVKIVMSAIEAHFPDGEMRVYFSCPTRDNWRTEVYPEYKANRPDRKPFWYDEIRQYIFDNWPCDAGVTHEADDLLSMMAYERTELDMPWVIVSIDKDFLQIPGQHYNWVKEELVDIDEDAGARNLAVQRIAGDGVDNIKGCPGIGTVKAEAHLFNSKAPNVHAMVLEAFADAYPDVEEALWQEALTTAMVTLPKDHDHVNELMEDVVHARKAYEASQATDQTAAASGGPAPD